MTRCDACGLPISEGNILVPAGELFDGDLSIVCPQVTDMRVWCKRCTAWLDGNVEPCNWHAIYELRDLLAAPENYTLTRLASACCLSGNALDRWEKLLLDCKGKAAEQKMER